MEMSDVNHIRLVKGFSKSNDVDFPYMIFAKKLLIAYEKTDVIIITMRITKIHVIKRALSSGAHK